MPELSPASATPQPSAQPGAQPGGGQGQTPPFGASPASGPTPNKGYEAAALQKLGVLTKSLTELVGLSGVGTDLGKDVLKALNILAKHVPPGSVSPAGEKNQIENMMMRAQQSNQQMQSLKQPQMGGQGAGAPPGGMPGMPRAA